MRSSASAEMAGCRRQALLAYFGQRDTQPCGNCDNCLSPPETIDGTVLAQKALSTAYRTGQRFGVGYLVDILHGKADERAIRNAHDRLTVFGIGKDVPAADWRGLFRQLAAAGYLTGDDEGYGTLLLTDRARPLLRGEEPFLMRRPRRGGAEEVADPQGRPLIGQCCRRQPAALSGAEGAAPQARRRGEAPALCHLP